MYCKKLILINWGNIPNLEFDLGPINLLSGGNGSGKTTVADALQSLMTASYENLFNYNPGQDETTQRGRGGKQVRTLASYVLGCDDGSYARLKPTDGYIVGVFHPTKGETGECFTAVLGSRAVIETAGKQRQARLRQLLFFIVPNQALDISQFMHEKKVTNLDEMGGLLKKRYGKDGVEIYDKKGAYLNRLYGAMRGMRSSVSKREAHHAAKTFSNFMAYKPVKSINDFVSKEILEPRDLSENIKQVSELMKTIHSMEAETRRITTVIDNLHELHGFAAEYIQHWLDWQLADYRELVRQLWVKQQAFLSIKSKQTENHTDQQETNLRLDELDEKRRIIHHKLVELEAKRQGIPALKNKDQLEKVIEANKGRLVTFAEPLLSQAQQLNKNHQLAKDLDKQIKESGIAAVTIPELGLKEFTRGVKAVIEHGTETDIDMSMLLTADFAGIANLENKLDKLRSFEDKHQALYAQLHISTAAASLNAKPTIIRDRIMAAHNLDISHHARLKEQVNNKKREIQQLNNQTVSYPSHVEAALEAIIRQCPQARPAVLCDYINITDDKWQMAIEGYIGGSRFSILVEPEFEAEAILIVRNIPGRRNNAKVIQGEKARRDAAKSSTPHHSILDVMTFEHKIAEYYIKGAYGNVIRVTDEQALRSTARGITPQGLASGGYAMFRTDLSESDLVFGQGARERALAAKQAQLEELGMKQHKAEVTAKLSAEILHTVDNIKPIQIGSLIQEMLSLYRTIENDETSLADLDLKDFESLEKDLEQFTAESELNADHIQRYQTKLGRLDSDAEVISKQAADISKQQESIQKQREDSEESIEGIADIYVAFDALNLLKESEEAALKYAKDANPDDGFAYEIEQHQKSCDTLERQLDKGILQHNQECRIEDSIIYQIDNGSADTSAHNDGWFKRIVEVSDETQNITNRLKNNVLVGKHERLADLRDGFNNAFVTDLCHSIYQSITDGKRILDELNKELEAYYFGTDKEYYYFGYEWVPEFREYQRFFKEVINLPSLGDGNSLFDAELSDKSAKVRDQLLSMLLDNDEHVAMQELKRLSDYRNYRAYEIYKKPKDKEAIALSQYGTGSGGQLETPAYIIRSAAVTSAFKFNEGTTHCRLVLVDEAFSKMDETRSREVIDYLTDKLGLQLIFIMPSSKSGPFMDLISHQTIFSKCPSNSPVGELKSQVLVDRKICNQDKIKDLWAQHRHVIRDQTTLDFMQEFAQTEGITDANN